MRLTPEQVRERFEREVKPDVCHCDQHGSRHVVPVEMAIAFAQLVARDLQAPPTGEEVERVFEEVDKALRSLGNAAYWHGKTDAEEHSDKTYERADKKSRDAEARAIETVRAYGAACHAAGRAESGNREPTDATESEAFCALKNRLTDLLNSHGHYREMTAYQGALERYREAVASEARRRSRKAVDVLRRLEAAASKCVRVKLTVIVGHVSGQAIVEADTDCGEPYVHAEGETLLDAIASAMDQLAAGAAKGRP